MIFINDFLINTTLLFQHIPKIHLNSCLYKALFSHVFCSYNNLRNLKQVFYLQQLMLNNMQMESIFSAVQNSNHTQLSSFE